MTRVFPTVVLMLGALAPCGWVQAATNDATMAPIEAYLMPADEEIALARSAAPPSISAKAEVLVLTRDGYRVAVKGSNGFVCFVERSWTAGFDDEEFWNPKTRGPNCFNPPAVHSVLPQYLTRTDWVLAGATRAELNEKARAAYLRHAFSDPDPNAFSFMLSKEGYLGDQAGGPWRPHVMFFVAYGHLADWGAGQEGSPVLGEDEGRFEPTTLFIPVPKWSDGSPAPLPGEHHHG